jgi:hypothetical protein
MFGGLGLAMFLTHLNLWMKVTTGVSAGSLQI